MTCRSFSLMLTFYRKPLSDTPAYNLLKHQVA
ncbi:hypothetical protein MHIR_DE00342 [Candidatus Doolittlea endobia]|uniref:Uncharacterized protein n=1 Tax=Candidatus Doolittlea endobia TaxID=1778262 RepID=A0A143WS41_9ENTR|nr:hypothetical protein MHIR_DE00342 [Candidatus Doolittlea endobia]